MVFAPHNLLGDPPFSRLDVVTCRNLLIYLERSAQRDVIELFHYALNPEGILLLGISEVVDATDLFRTESKKFAVFSKRNVPSREPRLPVFPVFPPGRQSRMFGEPANAPEAVSYAALHQTMLELFAPPSILIGPDDQILHLSGNAGRYLVHPRGEPTTNVYKLIREEMKLELRAALGAARHNNLPADSPPITVRFNGDTCMVAVGVRVSPDPRHEGFALITFDERESAFGKDPAAEPAPAPPPPGESESSRVSELERELVNARRRIQALIEEYETTQEEMRASNEEMQSTNEELRSTMEELETSKEELQSINEELQTVNQENRHKVEELSQLSSDLQNLLAATDIATLFLDRELRILRFTPRLADLFSVRLHDRGRPISDLTHRLGSLDLRADAESVLSRLIPVEREVQDRQDHWFLTRLLPYRSADDRILGVVITFVDITARRKAEETVRTSEERLRRMVSIDVVGVLIFDEEGTLLDSNEAFCKMSGYSREEVASKTLTWRTMTPPEYVEVSERQMENSRTTGHIGPYEKEYFKKDGSRGWMLFAGAALGDGTIIKYCIDISDRKGVEAELRAAKLYAEKIIETLHEPLLVLTPDFRVRSVNSAFYRSFETTPEATLGHYLYELGNGQWNIPELRDLLERILPKNELFENFEIAHTFDRIGKKIMLLNGRRLDSVQLILLGIRDVTAERQAAEALRESDQRFRLFVDSVSDYALFQIDGAGKIQSWNSGAERLLGWEEQEAIGLNASVIFTPEDVAAGVPEREMETARTTGRSEDERWHTRKDGGRFFASGVLTPVRGGDGTIIGFAKIMRDITQRKEYEEQLKRMVEEKDTLVREIHHRVKNNLQIIVSLLNIQASHAAQPDVIAAFEEAGGRLQAIARIHERLYASADLSEVEFSAYLRSLARELVRVHSERPDEVAVELEAAEIVLDIEQAIPLGLIANELILNSMKHGIQNRPGSIHIRLAYDSGDSSTQAEEDEFGWAVLEVRDSGPGLPVGVENSTSFGLKLVRLLARQLNANLEIRAGAPARVHFPLKTA